MDVAEQESIPTPRLSYMHRNHYNLFNFCRITSEHNKTSDFKTTNTINMRTSRFISVESIRSIHEFSTRVTKLRLIIVDV